MSFAVLPGMADKVIDIIVDMVNSQSRSDDAAVAVLRGIGVPERLVAFGWDAKRRMISLDEAYALDGAEGVHLIPVGPGKRGLIGAIAALGLSEEKYAAALENDKGFELIKRW